MPLTTFIPLVGSEVGTVGASLGAVGAAVLSQHGMNPVLCGQHWPVPVNPYAMHRGWSPHIGLVGDDDGAALGAPDGALGEGGGAIGVSQKP